MFLWKMLLPLNDEQRKMREMVKSRQDRGMDMVGEGTIRTDPKAIRQSQEYKDFKMRMRQYAEG